ncbi:MAG: hypothetical protein IJI68_05665 [Eggerthellaceae bacterium]|nr:hypothetical protein [Eggerthellaceae bacterium]
MVYWILIICAAIALVWYVREKIKAYSLKAVLIKSVVSVLFIAVGVCGLHASTTNAGGNPIGVLVVMGLVCGLLGDIWLDLKYVFPEQDLLFTYAGFAVFGIGHVLYIAGMLMRFYPPGGIAYVLAPIVLAIVMSVVNAALEKPMKLDYGRMKPVVIVYGVLLFATMLLSGSLALSHGWQEPALNLLFAGGILFAVSDLVLSGTYFGTGHERPIDFVLNYFTYYPAQFLIATALMFV